MSEITSLDAQIAFKTAQIDKIEKSKAEAEKGAEKAIKQFVNSTNAVKRAYVPGESTDDLLEERTYKPLKSGIFAAPETVLVAKDPEKVKTMIDHGMAAAIFTQEQKRAYDQTIKHLNIENTRLKTQLAEYSRGRLFQLAEDYQKGRLNKAELIKASGGLRNSLNLTRQDVNDIRQIAEQQRQQNDKACKFDRIIRVADRDPELRQALNKLFPPADQPDQQKRRSNRGQIR